MGNRWSVWLRIAIQVRSRGRLVRFVSNWSFDLNWNFDYIFLLCSWIICRPFTSWTIAFPKLQVIANVIGMLGDDLAGWREGERLGWLIGDKRSIGVYRGFNQPDEFSKASNGDCFAVNEKVPATGTTRRRLTMPLSRLGRDIPWLARFPAGPVSVSPDMFSVPQILSSQHVVGRLAMPQKLHHPPRVQSGLTNRC